MYIVDVNRGRWDAREIIDEMFNTQVRYQPEIFAAENGMISKSLGPFLKEQMMATGTFLNIREMTPVKDKETRARGIQARIKQGTVLMNGDADWYPDFESEMLRFPRDVHDDQVDALAWIGLLLNDVVVGQTAAEYNDEQWEDEFGDDYELTGICMTTGY
jgi:predicted phage terminase large subunit-like protein